MEGKYFIMNSLQPWDISIGSNAKDIAWQMAEQNHVLYINTPLDILTFFGNEDTPETNHRRKVIRQKVEPLRQIKEKLHVLDFPFPILPTNFLPDGKVFDFFNRLNNRMIFAYVRKKSRDLGYQQVIHINDNDPYRSFYAQEYLKPYRSIYYLRDMYAYVPYWQRHIFRIEPQLMQKSNLVIANSPQLASFAQQYVPKAINVGQGVWLPSQAEIDQLHIPADLQDIPRPIIGYTGAITALRLDYDLLYTIANERPQYSFVMVGGADEAFHAHPFVQLPNVYVLGPKKMNEVLAYNASFDVCLNPQLINEMTNCNYPRKIDEYLALGKPVVATQTQTMSIFDGYYAPATSAQDYIKAIDKLLATPQDEQTIVTRKEFAQSHSWQKNVEQIYRAIKQILD